MQKAENLIDERYRAGAADIESAYQQDWHETYRRFGPNSGSPTIEAARARALNAVKDEHMRRAQEHVSKFRKHMAELSEIRANISDASKADETALRVALGPKAESAIFPKVKQEDQQAELDKQVRHSEVTKQELNREFTTSQPEDISRPVKIPYLGLNVPFTSKSVHVPGGGAMVRQFEVDPDTGRRKEVKPTEANAEQRRRWAELTADVERSDAEASRLRRALIGGTFAQKAVRPGTSVNPTPTSTTATTRSSAPRNMGEFEAEVKRLSAVDKTAAKAYYDEWKGGF
jgi:hypothetical protein